MSDDESDPPEDNPTDLMASAADELPPSAASVAALARAAKRPKVSSSSSRPRRSSSGRTRPVVKLLVTSVSRSYNEPWRRRPQRESSGTGFLIQWPPSKPSDGIRIVTNAHVVRNASTVRARASFGPHVVSCEVEWLSLPLDLALLKIAGGDWHEFCRGWNFPELDPKVVGEDGKGKREDDGNSKAEDGMAAMNIDSEDGAKDGKLAEMEKLAEGGDGKDAGGGGRPEEAGGGGSTKRPDSSTGSKCLTFSAGLPRLDENVTCVGFPQGGSQISVTRGVVSRIDVDSNYVLRIQIDAAINPGNSGGPVFDEKGQVVGIASAHLRGASNVGYIIPSKIVEMFLGMCRDGIEVGVEDRFSGLGTLVVLDEQTEESNEPRHVPGISNLGIHGSQNLESKALRRSLGLEELDLSGGVRIVGAIGKTLPGGDEGCKTEPKAGEGESGVVKESIDGDCGGGSGGEDGLLADDVLLTINGEAIGMDGTIQLSPTRPDERINFRSLVTCQRVGSKVTLDVLRNKERKELVVRLDMSRFVVPQYDDYDAVPLYCVVGGCVFSPLTLPLVSEKKSKNPSSFGRYFRDQRVGNEQVLVLSKVLNDEVNVGYHGWKNLVLRTVNGMEVSNIQDLVGVLVQRIESETVEFRLTVVGQEDADYVICMGLDDVLSSESRILGRHMIASWASTDALSAGLRGEVEGREAVEAKRVLSWNSMRALRDVLRGDGETT